MPQGSAGGVEPIWLASRSPAEVTSDHLPGAVVLDGPPAAWPIRAWSPPLAGRPTAAHHHQPSAASLDSSFTGQQQQHPGAQQPAHGPRSCFEQERCTEWIQSIHGVRDTTSHSVPGTSVSQSHSPRHARQRAEIIIRPSCPASPPSSIPSLLSFILITSNIRYLALPSDLPPSPRLPSDRTTSSQSWRPRDTAIPCQAAPT